MNGQFYIDHRAELWKPRNAKGVRHRQHCLHDEPGVTICTCGGCRCSSDHPDECPAREDPRATAKILAYFLRACADDGTRVQPFMLRRVANVLTALAAEPEDSP